MEHPELAHLVSPMALAMTVTRDSPDPYIYVEHLDILSQELVMLRSRAPGWPRRLIITMPPRHGKSETTSKWFPTWDLAIEPADKIVLTSYEAEFAASWGRKVRRAVSENFPILGVKIMEDSKAAHRWETRQGGGMVTAGVGGPITGKGANILIIDDPIKNAQEANSQVIRDNIWDWWETTARTRMEPDRHGNDPIVIVIMTRWHEDDLVGRIKASSEADLWRELNLEAICESPDDPLGRREGDPLWPAKFSLQFLESVRNGSSDRAWQALYQQRPAPPEGSAINRNWWMWCDDPPPLDQFDQIIQSWDTTFSDAASADFVAGGVLGRISTPTSTRFYLIDCIHQRMNGPDTLAAIRQVDQQYPQAKWCIIEDSASGSMILDILERERGHVVRVKTGGRSKETRLHWGVNSAAAIIQRGGVYLPRGRAWANKLVDEGAAFPNGKHDDLIDMLVQGLERLVPKGWVSERRAAADALIERPKDLWDAMSQELHAKIRKRVEARQRSMRKSRRGDFWV